VSAVAIVLDRTTAREAVEGVREMGGGWALGLRVWDTAGLPYLILCASTADRVRRGMPLVLAAADVQQAAAVACDSLDNVQCAWLFVCSPTTRERVQTVLLEFTHAEGSA
jgi:hypothetical protein